MSALVLQVESVSNFSLQLGNKNDLEDHAPIKELIPALYVFYTHWLLYLIQASNSQLDKISDRPVSVSNTDFLFQQCTDARNLCSAIRYVELPILTFHVPI